MRKALKTIGLIVVAGVIVWTAWILGREAGRWWNRPPVYQEIGVIWDGKRVIPERIVMGTRLPVRLHMTSVSGEAGGDITAQFSLIRKFTLSPRRVTTVVLSRKQVKGLAVGGFLSVLSPSVQAPLEVVEKDGTVPPDPTTVAIVMTDELSAPGVIRAKVGVPLTICVTKTESDEEWDMLECLDLGVRTRVEDGKLVEMNVTPEKAGEYEFLGTVTPGDPVKLIVTD